MIKNIVQAVLYTLVAFLVGTTTDTMLPMIIIVIAIALAAFESSRFLSVFEVVLTAVAIIVILKGLWIVAIILLAALAVENIAASLSVVRIWLQKLDQKGGA